MKIFSINKLIFLLFFLLGCKPSFSQSSTSYFYENELDLTLPVGEKWAMQLGVGNRGMFQENLQGEKISAYQHKHLEISQFTNYRSTEFLVVSLGLRYRFKDLFDSLETNEFRIIEQLEYNPKNAPLQLSHRLRVEQRFREQTIHRIRYEAEINKSLNEYFSIGASTEALYAISTRSKPEAEQRISLGLANTSFSNLEIGIDLQYRLENYTRNPGHEFFIITGVSLDL